LFEYLASSRSTLHVGQMIARIMSGRTSEGRSLQTFLCVFGLLSESSGVPNLYSSSNVLVPDRLEDSRKAFIRSEATISAHAAVEAPIEEAIGKGLTSGMRETPWESQGEPWTPYTPPPTASPAESASEGASSAAPSAAPTAAPSPGNPAAFAAETHFLEKVLRSFGKLKRDYTGKQRLLGFQKGRLFDDNGMFAFDGSITSIAFDIGAANMPTTFDVGEDAGQLVFMFEPLPAHSDSMELSFERDNQELQKRGGCDSRWETLCQQDRFLWWKAAVSSTVGYTNFVVSDDPMCGSLGGFTDKYLPSFDQKLANDRAMSGILRSCWNTDTKSKSVVVPSVTLASIIRRIPDGISLKYLKINAQGHDFDVLKSAGAYLQRVENVHFEMQVDPPRNRQLVKEVPRYADVASFMNQNGFHYEGQFACDDSNMSPFSKATHEMDCKFCQQPPCVETGKEPSGMHPSEVVLRQGSWSSLVQASPSTHTECQSWFCGAIVQAGKLLDRFGK